MHLFEQEIKGNVGIYVYFLLKRLFFVVVTQCLCFKFIGNAKIRLYNAKFANPILSIVIKIGKSSIFTSRCCSGNLYETKRTSRKSLACYMHYHLTYSYYLFMLIVITLILVNKKLDAFLVNT